MSHHRPVCISVTSRSGGSAWIELSANLETRLVRGSGCDGFQFLGSLIERSQVSREYTKLKRIADVPGKPDSFSFFEQKA